MEVQFVHYIHLTSFIYDPVGYLKNQHTIDPHKLETKKKKYGSSIHSNYIRFATCSFIKDPYMIIKLNQNFIKQTLAIYLNKKMG